jgi:hypothetical protein
VLLGVRALWRVNNHTRAGCIVVMCWRGDGIPREAAETLMFSTLIKVKGDYGALTDGFPNWSFHGLMCLLSRRQTVTHQFFAMVFFFLLCWFFGHQVDRLDPDSVDYKLKKTTGRVNQSWSFGVGLLMLLDFFISRDVASGDFS